MSEQDGLINTVRYIVQDRLINRGNNIFSHEWLPSIFAMNEQHGIECVKSMRANPSDLPEHKGREFRLVKRTIQEEEIIVI